MTHRPTSHSFLFTAILLVFAGFSAAHAQGHGHHGSGQPLSWPDSLTTATFTGTVLLDSTSGHPPFFLDTNGDASPEWQLMFGPWWYRPASDVPLPAAGDSITILGAEMPAVAGQASLPGVVVFEINGQAWREPIAVGGHGWTEPGLWMMPGDTTTVTGVVLVDSTYFYPLYFLDTDGDSVPEYRLGFGPPWYAPDSAVGRPAHGESVTVAGAVHSGMASVRMLIVSRLNGKLWRPAGAPAPWAGNWLRRDMADSTRIWCANDSSNWLRFAPGNMGQGGMHMGGIQWPDSVFVQFWKIYSDSLPGEPVPGHFMGFYVNIQDPAGTSMMGGSIWGGANWGGHHGRVKFEQKHRIVVRYRDEDLRRQNLNESALDVRHWDPGTNDWAATTGAHIDPNANTIDIVSQRLETYYALYAPALTTYINATVKTPTKFKLYGNYPNPFNPQTTIVFELQEHANVLLEIYNLTGQRVATLVDGPRDAGTYHITWNGYDRSGTELASGTYLLQLQAGGKKTSQTMTLLK